MSVISNNQLAGAAGQGGDAGYKIDRSLRFNSGDSPSLTKTFASAGNRKTFTFSCWLKVAVSGTQSYGCILNQPSGDDFILYNRANGTLEIYKAGNSVLTTNAVFRDPSAWQHFVFAVDTTQSTASNRFRIYHNGSEITSYSVDNRSSNIAQNSDFSINSANANNIGGDTSHSHLFDGYMAEVYFIDGQQLAASDFGEYDDNNVWQPKEFTGSYTSTNTSTTLSQVGWNPSTTAAGNHTLIWDGTTTNKAYGYAGGTIGTVTFSPPLTGVTKVELYTQNYEHYLNGSSISTSETVNGGWHTYYDNSSSPITLNSVGNAYSGSTQTVDLHAIRINGTIIDSSTWTPPSGVGVQSSGGNSFYLKFADNSNNAALGTDSSGNSNTWTVNNLSAQTTSATNVNYDSSWTVTTNNGGVGTASISGNVATAVSGKWSGASSASALSTNSVSTAGFTTGSAGNTFFGLGKKLTTNYNATIRDSTQSYGLFTAWDGTSTNNNGGHGSSITATGFGNGDLIKFEVDPGNSTLKTYKNGVLQATDTLSSSFVSAIQNGDIYWQSDQYSTGSITLTNGEPDATSDSLIDTPTNYTADSGNNGGNYATFNPLDSHSQWTLSNGNLEITKSSSGGDRGCFLTLGPTSGKFYWEVTFTTLASENFIGLAKKGRVGVTTDIYSGGTDAYMYRNNGNKHGQGNGSGGASYGASWAANDVIGVAVDWDAGSITFYKNGSTQGAAWTGQDFSEYMPAVYANTNQSPAAVLNTGARPFAHTPPTGYKSLCTANLPTPTIADGSTTMDVKVYTGNGSNTNTISGLSMSPDLVWLKRRDSAGHHALYDAVRGAYKHMGTSHTSAEYTESTGRGLSAFNSDGFTIDTSNGEHQGSGNINVSSGSYVAWTWDAGSSTSSNTDGSITSSVRANTSAGFSIVTYTGNGSSSQNVGHGLNVAPALIIHKNRDTATDWLVRTTVVDGSLDFGYLNKTDAFSDASADYATAWTSSAFSIGSDSLTNTNGDDYVTYCFAPVESYSAMGVYTGNGSSDGPFVYTGFRPKYLLIKRTNSDKAWQVMDTERDPSNAADTSLFPAGSEAETSDSSSYSIDFLSNGFKLRTTHDSRNGSNDNYIYAAFAEHPFKTARAR